LSDDEITIIIFTSLDIDNLNNLIVLAGEFLKWFTLNYEGENREEIDFKDNKTEIWSATISMANLILQEFTQMPDNHSYMLTRHWWDELRFRQIG